MPIKSVYSPTHAVDIKRPDEQPRGGQLTRPRTRFRTATSGCSTTWPSQVVGRQRAQLPARRERRRLLPAAGQPGDRTVRPTSGPRKTVVFVVDRSGSMSGKKIEQAQEALEVRAEQPPRRRPVQHHGLRQRGRERFGRSCSDSTTDVAQGGLGFVRASTPAGHEYRRRADRPPWAC